MKRPKEPLLDFTLDEARAMSKERGISYGAWQVENNPAFSAWFEPNPDKPTYFQLYALRNRIKRRDASTLSLQILYDKETHNA